MTNPTTTKPLSLPEQRRTLIKQIAAIIAAFEEANPDLAVDDITVSRDEYYVNRRGVVHVDVDVKVW